ncbi:MAG: response regulator [SAR202 cluster bacterium]|jgi:DNA-binding response OmpR family regulator|nr:response regulator [SAR202 cluster bacterium]MDP6514984.1 response regulator [SAR202 cluster bacterium]|tara:strand:+ start:132 stop:521 length:390 start_codon:yes stop_codon:yes gene_type:complete
MPDTKKALMTMADSELSQELATLLDGLGYQVTEILDVSYVLENLTDNRYDLLVMGAALPDLSWQNTVDELRKTSNAARVVLMTRAAGEADLRSALNAGGYAVLERPISPAKLSDIIALPRYGMFVLVRD